MSSFTWRIFCQDEEIFIKVSSPTQPTLCPNNSGHTLDVNRIVKITEEVTKSVIVQEEIATGGHYRAESKKITIAANSTQDFDYSWKYNISFLTVKLNCGTINDSDILNTYIAPNTTVAGLTTVCNIGDAVLNVNNAAYVQVGYLITVGTDLLGECISKTATTVTLETPSTVSKAAGSPVKITVCNIKNFVLKGNVSYELGAKKITTSYIPANTTIRISYTNNGGVACDFFYMFEYLY